MDKRVRFRTGTNALLTLVLILACIALVNVLSTMFFVRADLTENKVYTLSEPSIEAVRALDDLEVRVFISEDLPDEIEEGWGRTRRLRGIERQFMDKLNEYRSYADGRMRLVRVRQDIESQAENARLRLFSADEARVGQTGMLEFTRYAVGATFSYKNITEVLPLALDPEHYEYEITKILLRLRERAEAGKLMDDILEVGEELFEAVGACSRQVERATQEVHEEGELPLGGDDPVARLSGQLSLALPQIKEVCDPLAQTLAAVEQHLAGRNEDLDRLLESVAQFVEFYAQLEPAMGASEPREQRRAIQIADVLPRILETIDHDHELLVTSPGRRTVGVLCGHEEFCPFAAEQPFIRPDLAQVLGQNNPFVERFVNQATQLEQEINEINESVRRGLFTMRGFDVRKVTPNAPLPGDINALLIYGPRKPMSERMMYEIDQFLLSGRPVAVLLNEWDVSLRNYDREGEMTRTEILPNQSNIGQLLESYGVTVTGGLVLEPERHGSVALTEVIRQGQLAWQSQRDFPFPLFPTFFALNQEHALVRGLSHLTLPYAAALDTSLAEAAGHEVAWLIRSSKDAVARAGEFPLLPPQLVEMTRSAEGEGPFDVAVYVAGEFASHFEGREEPRFEGSEIVEEDEDMLAAARRLQRGDGRLLVIGSHLGLENLSTERVFEGFDLAQLSSGGMDFLEGLHLYMARYQNWRLRIQQLGRVLQDTVRFLPNVMDWAVQNEELVSIRSKGFIHRPLRQTTEGQRRALRYTGILAAPLLFSLFGLIRWQVRKRRKPTF